MVKCQTFKRVVFERKLLNDKIVLHPRDVLPDLPVYNIPPCLANDLIIHLEGREVLEKLVGSCLGLTPWPTSLKVVILHQNKKV